ncbi:MAG: hypothetical protein HUK22_04675 [Thermoguttaceae bacterium]|nr:hypothetical protein [Thermoguttaceae bacterium]
MPLETPNKAQREKPVYDFDLKNVGQFCIVDGAYSPADSDAIEFIPGFVQGGLPIAYFRPSALVPYDNANKVFVYSDGDADSVSFARPYARFETQSGPDWFEANRFQLVHPGVDGSFGSGAPDVIRTLVGEPGMSPEDRDNIVNFAEAGRVESEVAALEE